MAGIELKHIQKAYTVDGRTLPVLKDICLQIPENSITILLGKSGCGKTTLLRLVGDLEEPNGGEIHFAVTHKTAFVFQEPRLMPWLTVWDNTIFGLKKHSYDTGEIQTLLEAVGLDGFQKAYPHQLSGGMRQRVMIARALCQQPRVLVLDEPTSFLDIRYKIELSAILLHLAREQGVTIVMSLHEIDLAARVSDLVMGIGTHGVEMFGAPEAVFTEENITKLYGISSGVYDALSGSMELPRAEGAPYAFVLGGMGKATTVYRRLTREGTPFATGILAENDMDIPAARHLAARILTTAPFAPPSEAVLTEARQTLLNCGALLIPDGLEAHAWDDELICFAQEHCVEVRHA